MYQEEDYLQISGIQHFSFCKRQWALIHIEKQWSENLRTVEGEIMHRRAHDSSLKEVRGNTVVVHGTNVASPTLGVSGQCDVVEYHKNENGITLSRMEGKWMPYPVEYKRGKVKEINADRLQLCCQAMCLEEMLCCDIPEGSLYYGETRKRDVVQFSNELRQEVKDMLTQMHQMMKRGYTPKVKTGNHCKACSLSDCCLPELISVRTVSDYIAAALKE